MKTRSCAVDEKIEAAAIRTCDGLSSRLMKVQQIRSSRYTTYGYPRHHEGSPNGLARRAIFPALPAPRPLKDWQTAAFVAKSFWMNHMFHMLALLNTCAQHRPYSIRLHAATWNNWLYQRSSPSW
ncbi:unnamed protein product [Cercospora beticola]|nr:unnamed protein product [Cercospora beticola]